MSDDDYTEQVPAIPSSLLIAILRASSLDDNPLSGSTNVNELAFEPALVDYMQATADYFEAAQRTIGVHAAAALAMANIVMAHASAHVDEALDLTKQSID